MKRLLPLLLVGSMSMASADAAKVPVELGDVPWLRNFEEATTKAKTSKRPLLVLFQEVPG